MRLDHRPVQQRFGNPTSLDELVRQNEGKHRVNATVNGS
jgi:hypothetical protein